MHINYIGFLNTTSQHILFATVTMIKNRKINNIGYGIKQVNKLYLKCEFKIPLTHYDSKFESIRV